MTEPSDRDLTTHYAPKDLLAAIEAALGKIGKSIETMTVDDLGPVDEFHLGGREASAAFLDQFGLASSHHLLDVGCGLGGTSRFAAARYGVRVTGVDLTPKFVETGQALCKWCGLEDRVVLRQGSVLALPFADEDFDGAYMLHVGMNIGDKAALAKEIYRVLRPGAVFGIYDVMRLADGDITLPVPWASVPADSHLASPEQYRHAMEAAGFVVEAERNRRDFALDFLKQRQAYAAAHGGPPPFGIHIVMGESAPLKMKNVTAGVADGHIAPVEMIGRKPA